MIPQVLGDRAARRLPSLVEDAEACPECGWNGCMYGQHLDGCELGALAREVRAITNPDDEQAWPPTWGRSNEKPIFQMPRPVQWVARAPHVTLAVDPVVTLGIGETLRPATKTPWRWCAFQVGAREPYASGEAPDATQAMRAAEEAGKPGAREALAAADAERKRAEIEARRTEVTDPERLLDMIGRDARGQAVLDARVREGEEPKP